MSTKQRAITVSQLNRFVQGLLSSQEPLRNLLVRGELSNVKYYSSGHIYFNLKDPHAQVSCVMFRQQAQGLKFRMENGQAVLASGRASLYERDGKFQLYVDMLEPTGVGDLHLAFEQLNQKLKAEGLFNAEHKRPLPEFPRRIGIATAATGAVIRDIIQVSRRRFPGCRLVLAPCQVQGPAAAMSIVSALRKLNSLPDVDLIIVGRGGGSMEDLWVFNEEIVAREVFNSAKPIISAVGHETDFTITDFVADLRAPTPSAAAELALPDAAALRNALNHQQQRLISHLEQKVTSARHRLERLQSNRYLENPYERLNDRRQQLDRLEDRLSSGLEQRLRSRTEQLGQLASRLDALSPLKVLARGYAMVSPLDSDLPIVTAKALQPKQAIRLHMQDGIVSCRVEDRKVNDNGPVRL